jgi:hypothetical protein
MVEEILACCSNCNKKLLTLYLKQDGELSNSIYVKCPFCQDHSYKYTYSGSYRWEEMKVIVVDIEMDGNIHTLLTEPK